MLGIRFFNGVAIDLFQGDVREFECDAVVNFEKNCLRVARDIGASHIVFPPPLESSPNIALTAMQTLKDALTTAIPSDAKVINRPLRRITFVLSDSNQYQQYRDALFATFEEI
jgi:hypothetical protein